jgi:hypothetical protein
VERGSPPTALERERAALKELLALESQREDVTSEEGAASYIQRTRLRAPLADFLIARVLTHGPLDKEGLRAEAELAGYLDDGNARAFHATLLNITKHRKLKQLPDGRYAAPNGMAETLFGLGRQTEERLTAMQ